EAPGVGGRYGVVPDVEVRPAALGGARLAHGHRVDDVVLPRGTGVPRDEHVVVHDADGGTARAGIVDVALGEDDGAVGQHVGVEREEVAVRFDELRLGPRPAGVV